MEAQDHSIFRKAIGQEGLDGSEQQQLIQACDLLQLAAGERLLSEGEVMHHFYFLRKGAILVYQEAAFAERQIKRIYSDQEWMSSPSLINRQPSELIYELATDTQLYRVSMENLHKLIGESQRFLILARVFMNEHKPFEGYQARMSPEEKYGQLLAQRPQLLQYFPLKVIAAYLEMTPETLSRVRKKISQ